MKRSPEGWLAQQFVLTPSQQRPAEARRLARPQDNSASAMGLVQRIISRHFRLTRTKTGIDTRQY